MLDEDWETVCHDWTSFRDTSKWPERRNEYYESDLTIPASAMIRKYYLRQHFVACVAQENRDTYGDDQPGRAMMLFPHVPYYLKHGQLGRPCQLCQMEKREI